MLDQQSDVVVVFWALYILPNRELEAESFMWYKLPFLGAEVACPVHKAVASNRQKNSIYDEDISLLF